MAFTPVHGSRGRLTYIVTTPDLTGVRPTLTGLTQAPVNGITKWKVNKAGQMGDPIHHFEGTTNSFGIIAAELLYGGVEIDTLDFEGYFDLDSSVGTAIIFDIGTFFVADLIWNRATGLTGHSNVAGKVTDLNFGPEVKGGPAMFTAKAMVHLVTGAPATTTTSSG